MGPFSRGTGDSESFHRMIYVIRTHLFSRVHPLAQDDGAVGAVPECLQCHVAVHHDWAGWALHHSTHNSGTLTKGHESTLIG